MDIYVLETYVVLKASSCCVLETDIPKYLEVSGKFNVLYAYQLTNQRDRLTDIIVERQECPLDHIFSEQNCSTAIKSMRLLRNQNFILKIIAFLQ